MSDVPQVQVSFDPSNPFKLMAGKIERNGGVDFGGAFVLVPPEGTVVDLLILDSNATPAVFWSLIQTKAQIALAELEADSRQGFSGQRRR